MNFFVQSGWKIGIIFPGYCFTIFKTINKQNTFSIPKHRCHELSCWWNRPCFLWRWTTGFCPLLWLLFGFWCVMVNPCLIHSNKSTYIIIYQSKRSNILIMTEYSNIQNFKFCCLTQYFPRRIWEVNLKANRDAKLGSTWQYLAVLGSTCSNPRFPINHDASKKKTYRNSHSGVLSVGDRRSPSPLSVVFLTSCLTL